jgi:hypothetical protein
MNGNSKMAADRLHQGFSPLHILSGTPALAEIEDILGTLVIASGASGTRQQSGKPLLLEGLIGDIECLSADTESFGDVADWPPSTRWRRSISYLTCTRSRGSKNSSWPTKASSRTLCGRGYKAPAAQSRRLGIVWSSRRHFVSIVLNTEVGSSVKPSMAEGSSKPVININIEVEHHWLASHRPHRGRNTLDTLDEIRLTVSVSSLVTFRRFDQVSEQQQVLDPDPSSAPAHYLIGIGGRGVGPIHRY